DRSRWLGRRASRPGRDLGSLVPRFTPRRLRAGRRGLRDRCGRDERALAGHADARGTTEALGVLRVACGDAQRAPFALALLGREQELQVSGRVAAGLLEARAVLGREIGLREELL